MTRDEYDRFLTVTYCVLALLVTMQIVNVLVLPIPAGVTVAAVTLGFLGLGMYGLLIGHIRLGDAPTRGHGKADRP